MQILPLLAWALLSGCGTVTGPGIVRGFRGGSLPVTCTYQPGSEKLPKLWCKPSVFYGTCGKDTVITWKSESAVLQRRFSIRDSRTHRPFTVTVDGLSKEDPGTFRCGMRAGKLSRDDSAAVDVIVISASSTLPSLTYTTTTFSDLILSVTGCPQTVPQAEIVPSTSNPSTPQLLNMAEHILTLAIIVVLFLLAMAASVLVILSRKKKATSMLHPAPSGAAIGMDRTYSSMSPTGAEALNYADNNHDTGAAESQYSNAEAFCRLEMPPMEYIEIRHSAEPLEEEREALYGRVQKPVPQQGQIYANVPLAPRSSEELYSTVWGR